MIYNISDVMFGSDIDSAKNVGKRVRWVREFHGLKQIEFSRILGLPKPANLSNWENGHQRLSIDGALAINRHFGITLDFLYLNRLEGLSPDMIKSYSSLASEPLESADLTSESSGKPVK